MSAPDWWEAMLAELLSSAAAAGWHPANQRMLAGAKADLRRGVLHVRGSGPPFVSANLPLASRPVWAVLAAAIHEHHKGPIVNDDMG